MKMRYFFIPILLLLAVSVMAQPGTSTLTAGTRLTEGQRLVSANKNYYLTMQADGNLCIYTATNAFVWCSMVNKGKGSYLALQADGNLVVYDGKNQPVWDSKTQSYFDPKYATAEWKPVRAVLENDGTLGLYSASNKKVWSNTAASTAKVITQPEGFSGPVVKKQVKIVLPFAKTAGNVEVEITPDGRVIYQSDMELGTVESLQDPQAEVENSRRWPNSVIPYILPANHKRRDVILKGIAEMNAKTNICLVPRTTEKDYVEFISKNGNWSVLGRKGGRQEISIENESLGTVCHEILHCLGFYHTQSREDRDKFVSINFGNIEGGKESNFQKESDKASNLGNYDFASVLHYSAKAFAKNKSINTISLIKAKGGEDAIMGQRTGLSPGDIANVAIIYAKGPCKPGYVAPKPGAAKPATTAPATTATKPATGTPGRVAPPAPTTPVRVAPPATTTTTPGRTAKKAEPLVDGKKVIPIPVYKPGTEKFIDLIFDEKGIGNENVGAKWLISGQSAEDPKQAVDGHKTNNWSEEARICRSGEELTPGLHIELAQVAYVEYIEIWNSSDASSLKGRNFYITTGAEIVRMRVTPEPLIEPGKGGFLGSGGIFGDGLKLAKREAMGPYAWPVNKDRFIIPIKSNVKVITISLQKNGLDMTPITMEEVVIIGKKLEPRKR